MKKVLTIICFGLFLFSISTVVYAGLVPCGLSQDDPDQPGDQTVPCTLCHFFEMIDRIIDFILFIIVPPLAILMIAIGGFMYIFAPLSAPEALAGGAKGGAKMLSQAKHLLTSVIFGLIIIYGAFLIIGVFFKFIGLADWTHDIYHNWWEQGIFEIECGIETAPSPLAPASAPAPAPASTPAPAPPFPQISLCSLCPGNSVAQCDRDICEGAIVDCNYIQITLIGGRQGGVCVAPNDCGTCATLGPCDSAFCSKIGDKCRFIKEQFGLGGMCVAENECEKCGQLQDGCFADQCSQIGNRCIFTPNPVNPARGFCLRQP